MEKEVHGKEKEMIERSQFEKVAYIMRAMANEIRLCVILQLANSGEKTVSALMEKINCEQSLLSHHLTDMRAKGILKCRKCGKNKYYSLSDQRYSDVLHCMMNCAGNNAQKGIDNEVKRQVSINSK